MANATQIKLLGFGVVVVVFTPPDLLFYLGLLDLNIMSQLLITCLSFCTLQPKKKSLITTSHGQKEKQEGRKRTWIKIIQKASSIKIKN